MILAPEHLQQISDLLTRTLQEGGTEAGGTETAAGQQQEEDTVTSMTTDDTIGNATGQ
jgi:hypothetical protein